MPSPWDLRNGMLAYWNDGRKRNGVMRKWSNGVME
jgi:hypothetical protein